MVTIYEVTPPPTLARIERDIPLGESASVNNVFLTMEHITKLRTMVATKVKLRRFLCSSDEEIPIKLRKVESDTPGEISADDKTEEGERREFKVIKYRGIFHRHPNFSFPLSQSHQQSNSCHFYTTFLIKFSVTSSACLISTHLILSLSLFQVTWTSG